MILLSEKESTRKEGRDQHVMGGYGLWGALFHEPGGATVLGPREFPNRQILLSGFHEASSQADGCKQK